MFEDWRQAWRQAVENFRREASGGIEGSQPRVRAMERELTSVNGTLLRLDDEIRRTQRELDHERNEEAACRRREGLARGVGDEETVRVAASFAARHAERAALLERKIAVLVDERELVARDVDMMKETLAEVVPDAVTGATSPIDDINPTLHDAEYYRMERERRERAATERLEELKRRMNR